MIIEYIYNNGSIKSKDIETLLNIKESRIRELLRKLVEKEYIERQGKARNTFYILKKKTDIRGTLT
jgi:DNA-binding MarR family transcriptional regulator